jgi:protein-disulfide isomerase
MGVLAVAGVALLVVALRIPGNGRSPSLGPLAAAPGTDAVPQAFPGETDVLGVAIGAKGAPVVVREFGDYQCPACAQFFPAAERLRGEYVRSGRVRFVFFDFPLTQVHPNALAAAQAARCAGRLGNYWAMHDALFQNQAAWAAAADPVLLFQRYAQAIGLDGAALARCVRSGAELAPVQQSAAFGRSIGVRGTPTVVVDDVALPGVPSYSQVRSLIERALAQRSKSSLQSDLRP